MSDLCFYHTKCYEYRRSNLRYNLFYQRWTLTWPGQPAPTILCDVDGFFAAGEESSLFAGS